MREGPLRVVRLDRKASTQVYDLARLSRTNADPAVIPGYLPIDEVVSACVSHITLCAPKSYVSLTSVEAFADQAAEIFDDQAARIYRGARHNRLAGTRAAV